MAKSNFQASHIGSSFAMDYSENILHKNIRLASVDMANYMVTKRTMSHWKIEISELIYIRDYDIRVKLAMLEQTEEITWTCL